MDEKYVEMEEVSDGVDVVLTFVDGVVVYADEWGHY